MKISKLGLTIVIVLFVIALLGVVANFLWVEGHFSDPLYLLVMLMDIGLFGALCIYSYLTMRRRK